MVYHGRLTNVVLGSVILYFWTNFNLPLFIVPFEMPTPLSILEDVATLNNLGVSHGGYILYDPCKLKSWIWGIIETCVKWEDFFRFHRHVGTDPMAIPSSFTTSIYNPFTQNWKIYIMCFGKKRNCFYSVMTKKWPSRPVVELALVDLCRAQMGQHGSW